jgi:hypothetical protein
MLWGSMKILIRLFALWFVWHAYYTTLTIATLARSNFWGRVNPLGLFGYITLVYWVFVLAVGLFGAVQIWRLKATGRFAGIVLSSCIILYYFLAAILLGLVYLKSFNVGAFIMISLAGLVLLFSGPAKRLF